MQIERKTVEVNGISASFAVNDRMSQACCGLWQDGW
jgi:hypothetical protein